MAGKRYTTWGPVRGDCGHEHRTMRAACECVERDQRGCAKQGGYTDRHLRVLDPGHTVNEYDTTQGPGRMIKPEEAE